MTSRPPRTITAPAQELPPVLMGPDLVTAIRECGGGAEYPLLVQQIVFTVGSSPSCHVRIDSEHVSWLHCVLERRGQRLRVQDQNSHNGTFLRGRREPQFDVGAGDVFQVATSELLVLDDSMRLARPLLSQIIGYDRGAEVDELLCTAMTDRPILIVGPNGAGQRTLAHAIHEMSHRRHGPFVPIPALLESREAQRAFIDGARRGTLVVTASGEAIDEAFVDMVTSPAYRVRLIVLAPSVDEGAAWVKADALIRMSRIELRPLRERQADLRALLDHLFVASRMSLRFTDLTARNQRALLTHSWPENLDELHKVVGWFAQILHAGSIRRAATALHVPRSSLAFWLDQMKVKVPLTSPKEPRD